ncbi:hypothetical protein [Bdellovibrio sp. HCB209]|uniref:hypothetical protein n=1 Tax=Bdellovibrio sp. HCB209 TaxID=3394354 RepID=UPI0039B68431
MRTLFLTLIVVIPFYSSAQTAMKLNDWAVPVKLEDLKSAKENAEIEKKFTPPITSQDSLGICYASAAATVINYEMCKLGKIEDCKSAPESKRISSLGIARYSSDADAGKLKQIDKNYSKLDVESLRANGNTILNVATQRVIKLPTEQCSSLDRVLSKNPVLSNTEVKGAQAAIWESLKSDYDNYRKAIADKCDECASKYYESAKETVSKNLKIEEDQKVDSKLRNDSVKVLQAFQRDSYAGALNALLYPEECSKSAIPFAGYGKTDVESFPVDPAGVTSGQMLDEIKKVLQKKQPVLLEDICVADCDSKDPKNPPKTHAVVVAGYRKICSKKDPTRCRTALKVINSYGASWQKANSDGWIESEPLLGSVRISNASMSWLSPRP